MVSRTGILSNAMMDENCMDYKILPLGFANTNYDGGLSNPFLQGIKTSKYIRVAPKPASADVAAVSSARLMGGNRPAAARAMLDLYRREAKAWTPPPISLEALNRSILDTPSGITMEDNNEPLSLERRSSLATSQAVSIIPTSSSGSTIGTLSLKQTIGTDAQSLATLTDKYMAKYNSMTGGRQAKVGQDILDRAISDNLNLFRFELNPGESKIQSGVIKGKGTLSSPSTKFDELGGEGTRPRMVRTAIRAFYTMNSNVDLNQIFGMMPVNLGKEIARASPGSMSGTDIMSEGGATSLSGASTQQGVAEPATTSYVNLIERK
tara:strand:+ start:849 stop:1814 length:966 start_codon:yes stop_codon:yes gene_type:complete